MVENEYVVSRLHEAQHRYANWLQILHGIAKRKLRAASSTETREALSYIVDLIEILGELQRCVQSADGTTALADHLDRCRRYWQRLCNGQIEIRVEADRGLAVAGKDMTSVSLIVNELVLNAVKHAFPNGGCGVIRIIAERDGEDHARITVMDNGVGCTAKARHPEEQSAAAQHGTALVEALASALGGTTETGSPDETSHAASIRWPL